MLHAEVLRSALVVDGDVVHSGSWLVGQKRKAAVHVTCACDHSCACMCVRLPNADTLL